MKKIGCYTFSVVFMLVCLFSFTASAAQKQRLCVNYSTDEYALCDASFSLYYIGTLSGRAVIPNSTFSAYSVDYDISDSEKMTNLALTLSGYILRDNIVPDYTGKTDADGKTDFGGVYLSRGVYVLMAEKHHQNDTMYFCKPTLIVLPYGESDTLNVSVKYEAVPDDTKTVTVTYKVLKAWVEDEGIPRPVKIEVELLRDGEVYDTVMLDYSNNWRYQWDGLSVFYHWTVVEKWVSEGYKVMLSQDGKTLLLTNSGAGPEETTAPQESTTVPEETTTIPDETTVPSATTSPDESTTSPVESTAVPQESTTAPGETTGPSKPGSTVDSTTTRNDSDKTTTGATSSTKPSQGTSEPELPVTGTLQWPIPYLALTGLLLFIIGYAKYRKSELADE